MSGEGPLLAYDLGGTRVKSGYLIAGRWHGVSVRPSPRSVLDWMADLREFVAPHPWADLLLAIPGRLTVTGETWQASRAPFVLDAPWSIDDLSDLFAHHGLPRPSVVDNDLTATARGISQIGDAIVVQFSTGIGARVVLDGQVQMTADGQAWQLADVRAEAYRVGDEVHSFDEWCSLGRIAERLREHLGEHPPALLAATVTPEATAIREAMIAYVKECVARAPARCRATVVLCGGGAQAWRDSLLPALQPSFHIRVLDPQTAVLDGLVAAYRVGERRAT